MSFGRKFDYARPREGRMVINSLHRIEENARRLRLRLQEDDDLPTWVHYKINTADDRLESASNYMLGKMRSQGVKLNPAEAEDNTSKLLLAGLSACVIYKLVSG